LKAGLGTVRVAVAFEAAVAWACIGAFAETLRLVVVWVEAAVFVLL
jgi:hypothetical protein